MIGTPRFQHGSLIRVKNKTIDDTWFLRFYEDVQGRCVYRKQRIGTVREFPRRADAERAVLTLRAKINVNSGHHSPETVRELLEHYKEHELAEEGGKRSSTREVYAGYLKVQIEPRWGNYRLDQIKTIEVERWLRPCDQIQDQKHNECCIQPREAPRNDINQPDTRGPLLFQASERAGCLGTGRIPCIAD
jgi:hypothetical protein